jgi:hypothetical protein
MNSTPQFAPGLALQDGTALQQLANAISLGAPVNYCSSNRSIQSAVNQSVPGTIIVVAPGSYNETVTIPRGAGPLTIVAANGRNTAAIAPSTTNANALVNNSNDVTLLNMGLAANGTGKAFVNTGSQVRLLGCKLENDDGTGECAQLTLNTVVEHNATPRIYGNGADVRFEGCEFAWAADGIELVCTDWGAVTELQVVNCWFHDLDGKHIYETVGSGGSAGVMYASILLQNNVHSKDEAGTAPTDYILLNGDNANTGLMTGCVFPQVLAGGKVLLSTALICVGCFFIAGLSTTQPS